MYYCIIIYEKHLTALSEHRSYQKCAKDENNAKETMRVFYTTNRVDLRVLIVHSGHFVTQRFRPHFCPYDEMLGNVVPIQKYKTRVVYKGITRDGEKCNEAKWNLIGGIQFKQENTNRLLKFILKLFHLLGKTLKEIYHSLVF